MNETRPRSAPAPPSMEKQLTCSSTGVSSCNSNSNSNSININSKYRKTKEAVCLPRITLPSASFPSILVPKKQSDSDGIPEIETAASMETDRKARGTTNKGKHRETKSFDLAFLKPASRRAMALSCDDSENGTKSKRWPAIGSTKSFEDCGTKQNRKSIDSSSDSSRNTKRITNAHQSEDANGSQIRQQNRLRTDTFTSFSSGDCDASTATSENNDELEQLSTALVWKRRSGWTSRLHSHSKKKKLWEIRRITLKGHILCYYKSTDEIVRGEHQEDRNTGRPHYEDEDSSSSSESEKLNGRKKQEEDDSGGSDGNKNMIGGLRTFLDYAKQQVSSQVVSSFNNGEPRGVLDIVRENASVAATSDCEAPTPFSILVQTPGTVTSEGKKWRFCFDKQHQQMEWLAALTDVVVARSVEKYNHEHGLHGEAENCEEKKRFYVPANTWNVSWVEYKRRETALGEDNNKEIDQVLETASTDEKSISSGSEVADGGKNKSDRTLHAPTSAIFVPTTATTTWTVSRSSLQKLVCVVNVLFISSWYLAATKKLTWVSYAFLFVAVNVNFYIYIKSAEPLLDKIDHRPSGVSTKTPVIVPTRQQEKHSSLSLNIAASNTAELTVSEPMSKQNRSSTALSLRSEEPTTSGQNGAFKPLAGSTTVQLENPNDPSVNADNHPFIGWRAMPGSVVHLRGPDYLSSNKKEPSPSELYSILTVDVFEATERPPDMSQRVHLPMVEFDDGGKAKTWVSPDTFVISFAVPTKPPKLGFSSEGTEHGYVITMYYALKDETRRILQTVTSPDYDSSVDDEKLRLEAGDDENQSQIINGVKLWEDWCRRAPTDPKFQARFKCVPNAHNLRDIGVPSWICKYNGKPFLIKRTGVTGFLYSHPEQSLMEFDVTLHPFPYLAKQALSYLKEHYYKKLLITFSFCIEGREEDELPEIAIGNGVQLCYLDPDLVLQAEDVFANKTRSSL